jgi:phage terminase small subunit
MPILKNTKHEAFAQAVAKGQTAEDAYIAAGYTPNRGNAGRLKANEVIRKRVAELMGRSAERAEIDIARTLKELVRLGTSDVRRLFDESGALRPVHSLDDETAAAVASVEVVTRPGAEVDENGNREVEYVHKLKLWDKNSALDKIAKHLGMFIERHEHTGEEGGPIVIERRVFARAIDAPHHDPE